MPKVLDLILTWKMILAEETKLVASKVTKFKISFDEKSNILKVPNSNASTTSTYNMCSPKEAHDLKMRFLFLQIVKLNALHPQQQQKKNTLTKTATTTITKSFTTKTSYTKIFLPKRLCWRGEVKSSWNRGPPTFEIVSPSWVFNFLILK